MTELNVATTTKRASWIVWMHVAGVAYALAIWVFIVGLFLGAPAFWMLGLGIAVFTVATAAFIGGWGRYLATKTR